MESSPYSGAIHSGTAAGALYTSPLPPVNPLPTAVQPQSDAQTDTQAEAPLDHRPFSLPTFAPPAAPPPSPPTAPGYTGFVLPDFTAPVESLAPPHEKDRAPGWASFPPDPSLPASARESSLIAPGGPQVVKRSGGGANRALIVLVALGGVVMLVFATIVASVSLLGRRVNKTFTLITNTIPASSVDGTFTPIPNTLAASGSEVAELDAYSEAVLRDFLGSTSISYSPALGACVGQWMAPSDWETIGTWGQSPSEHQIVTLGILRSLVVSCATHNQAEAWVGQGLARYPGFEPSCMARVEATLSRESTDHSIDVIRSNLGDHDAAERVDLARVRWAAQECPG